MNIIHTMLFPRVTPVEIMIIIHIIIDGIRGFRFNRMHSGVHRVGQRPAIRPMGIIWMAKLT